MSPRSLKNKYRINTLNIKHLVAIVFSLCLFSCSQKKEDIFYLKNKNGKGFTITEQTNSETITNTFGTPLSVEHESKTDAEGLPSWTNIKYSGLTLELVGTSIDGVTITGDNWSIGGITIGTDAEFINDNFKLLKKEGNYLLYQVPDFDGVLFVKLNTGSKVIECGLSNPS
ncbi:hypothetical protein [Flavobacterium psychrotrophum]|uniref:hypothetical protein n=1 Tax=Flavobacterium psychrotrophum TaxID=2294119 RepID=UPI000E3249AC|nr:hypothetical protein [Flavobacterium psychrotrophum]